MRAATGRSAAQRLDQIYALGQLVAFDPEEVVALWRDELAGPGEGEVAAGAASEARLAEHDAAVRAAIAVVEAFAVKAMRIRLDHALANDHAVGKPLRSTLAHTVAGYQHDLGLLHERVASTAARVDPAGAAAVADAVVAAARAVLEVRATLISGLFELARAHAAAAIPAVTTAARDRYQADAARLRWLVVRRDLELVVADPSRIATAAYADRLQALPVVDEAPEEAPELSLGELIEPY